MISCIVPVYNNQRTVLRVLNILLSCDDIDEIIVVDDFSEDNSAKKIKALVPKIKAVFNQHNLGKGSAVVKGIRIAKGETILVCDADLSTIKKHHITNLIREYKLGGWDMVIAGRESDKGWWYYLMARLSGERIFKKRAIEQYLKIIAQSGNGVEQIINFCHRDKKVKIIISKNIGHILKYQRGNLKGALVDYVQEIFQIIKTHLVIKKYQLLSSIASY